MLAGFVVVAPLDAQPLDLDQIRQALLTAHNTYRARHAAPPLRLDAKLNAFAQEYATRLAKTGKLVHREQSVYGENLFAWTTTGPGAMPATQAADSWYAEAKLYRFHRPGFAHETGHFTQVVWKGTRLLGCGAAKQTRRRTTTWVVVCNYDPGGNVEGWYRENVAPAR
jgi:uncharacterized protein YkwD